MKKLIIILFCFMAMSSCVHEGSDAIELDLVVEETLNLPFNTPRQFFVFENESEFTTYWNRLALDPFFSAPQPDIDFNIRSVMALHLGRGGGCVSYEVSRVIQSADKITVVARYIDTEAPICTAEIRKLLFVISIPISEALMYELVFE